MTLRRFLSYLWGSVIQEKGKLEIYPLEKNALPNGNAQNYYLKKEKERTLTETVKNFKRYLPNKFFVLPHPSPRNNIWMKKNEWFKTDVLPEFKDTIKAILNHQD